MSQGSGRTAILLAVILLLTVLPIYEVPKTAEADLSDPSALKNHSIININGNSQFTSANGVVKGSGSSSDPYIFENWSIKPTSRDFGIYIRNTNAHFLIRNCKIYDGRAYNKYGIYCSNVVNGSVIDCRIFNNYYGIYISSSKNITISNNSVYKNRYDGISISSSDNFVIKNNEVYSNTNHGIYSTYSTSGILFNNTFNNNLYNFYVYGSQFNHFNHTVSTNNTAEGKPIFYLVKQSNQTIPTNAGFVGLIGCLNISVSNLSINNSYSTIFLFSSENCSIFNNNLIKNYNGIELLRSKNNFVFNNTYSKNTYHSIHIENSQYNQVFRNSIFDNSGDGVFLLNSDNNFIFKNELIDSRSIYILQSDNNRIYYNNITNCYNGIDLSYSSGNIFYNNNIMNISINGFYLFRANNNRFFNNSVYNIRNWGTNLETSINNTFYDNLIFNMSDGLYLSGSQRCIFFNNTFRKIKYYYFGVSTFAFQYLYHWISKNNTFNGKPSYYIVDESNITIPLNVAVMGLINCDNITVKDLNITKNMNGIIIYGSKDCLIINNTVINNQYYGIRIYNSERLIIQNNSIFQRYCVYISGAKDISFMNNYFINNSGYYGFYCWNSEGIDIINNSIPTYRYSIFLSSSRDCLISDNFIYKCTNGLYLYSSINISILENIIEYNEVGISFHGSQTIPSKYCNISNNFILNNTDQGIYCNQALNNTLSNNNINDNNVGIDFYKSNYNKIYNNTIHDNDGYGIDFQFSNDNIILNNTVDDHYLHGIYFNDCDDSIIYDNILLKNRNGITIFNSKNNSLENNSIYSNTDRGIYLTLSTKNSINDNSVHDNTGDGIYLSDSKNNVLKYNDVYKNRNGINVDDSDNNKIKNNIANDNDRSGIVSKFSDKTYIFNNTAYDNSQGIRIFSTNDSQILNNTVFDNSNGIEIHWRCIKNFVMNNFIVNNSYGISVENSGVSSPFDLNLIINNYFNNTNNYIVTSSAGNNWGMGRTAGKNIIGGHFIGGNYWSDYKGSDNDGDGLGNTNIPFGPGDRYPLCYKIVDTTLPLIWDETSGSPYTGETFTLSAEITDYGVVDKVYYEYWFDNNAHHNKSVNRTSGTKYKGIYSLDISVPKTVFSLRYIMTSTDETGNLASEPIEKLEVLDNILPEITDYSESNPTTGDNFTFKAEVVDNVNISKVTVEYWFDDYNHETKNLIKQGNLYLAVVQIPPEVKKMNYRFTAWDNSSNWKRSDLRTFNVTDNDKPEIIDNSGTPKPGSYLQFKFTIKDNIGISKVYLEYWLDHGKHSNVTLTKGWSHTIEIPYDAYIVHALVTAIDKSDNYKQLIITKPVDDSVAPVIDDYTTDDPETGEVFKFKCEISDNGLLRDVSIEYWFNDNPHVKTPLKLGGFLYYLDIDIPDDAVTMNYIVRATDYHDNEGSKAVFLEVKDIISPKLIDSTVGEPVTGGVFDIIATAEDNVGIEKIYIEYWFDDDKHETVNFVESFAIQIPINARLFHYNLYAYDLAQNSHFIFETLEIIDNIKPTIQIYNSGPINYGDLNFITKTSDNIGVELTYIEYWFDNGLYKNVTFKNNLTIIIPDNASMMRYRVTAIDGDGNSDFKESILFILDDKKPVVLDKSTVEEDGINFHSKVTDNIAIQEVKVTYRFDDGNYHNVTLELNETDRYLALISIPTNAKVVNYKIIAEDTSKNIFETKEHELILKTSNGHKQEPETPGSETEEDNLVIIVIFIIIIIIVLIAIAGFYFYKNKREKKPPTVSTTTVTSGNIEEKTKQIEQHIQNRIQPTQVISKPPPPQTKPGSYDFNYLNKQPPSEPVEVPKKKL